MKLEILCVKFPLKVLTLRWSLTTSSFFLGNKPWPLSDADSSIVLPLFYTLANKESTMFAMIVLWRFKECRYYSRKFLFL